VRKEALANTSNRHHAQAYIKVTSMLTNDASFSSNNSPCDVAKEVKKKWKSMMGLKMYTESSAKKSRRDSNKFKGWSEEGKAFVVKMTSRRMWTQVSTANGRRCTERLPKLLR
jgi:hypothetical protein